jgi:hypothetical protein
VEHRKPLAELVEADGITPRNHRTPAPGPANRDALSGHLAEIGTIRGAFACAFNRRRAGSRSRPKERSNSWCSAASGGCLLHPSAQPPECWRRSPRRSKHRDNDHPGISKRSTSLQGFNVRRNPSSYSTGSLKSSSRRIRLVSYATSCSKWYGAEAHGIEDGGRFASRSSTVGVRSSPTL